MPIFDYQCLKCNNVFDVYHRGAEKGESVKCPSCGSVEYKKLVSVPAAVGHASSNTPAGDACSSPMGGCCGGGMCGMN